jgi:hypothetical protein
MTGLVVDQHSKWKRRETLIDLNLPILSSALTRDEARLSLFLVTRPFGQRDEQPERLPAMPRVVPGHLRVRSRTPWTLH